MDFIIKLLKSRDLIIIEVYNTIIVIINRLIKYIIILPFKKNIILNSIYITR